MYTNKCFFSSSDLDTNNFVKLKLRHFYSRTGRKNVYIYGPLCHVLCVVTGEFSYGNAWVVWHRSVAWNPSGCQVQVPKSHFAQVCIRSFDSRTVQCYSTLHSAAVSGSQSIQTSCSLHTPPHSPSFLGEEEEGGASHLHPSVFLFSHFLIGLIPCSLACPIIFWNIQGNVSSCCHSNYYNTQHGSWLSSFLEVLQLFVKVLSHMWGL